MSPLSRDQKEIALGKGSRWRMNPLISFCLCLAVALFTLYIVAINYFKDSKDPNLQEQIRIAQINELEAERNYYAEWLEAKLGYGSRESYETLSAVLVSTVVLVPESDTLLADFWMALHRGLARVIFLFIAWWKLWFIAMTVAVIWSMKAWQVYLKEDLLGKQTNGRLFYSGIRGDFKKVAPNGAPDVQVPGLACLKRVPQPVAKSHRLGKILETYGAANNTNLALVSTICAYENWPAFVPPRNEQALLTQAFQNTSLVSYATTVLEATLSLREAYLDHKDDIAVLDTELSDISGESPPYSVEQYVKLLKNSLNRVLTPEWKVALAELSAKELAAIVLSHEAGKIMAFSHQGGHFYRSSNFPQLCARAVLHSIPEYSQDFSFAERNGIRRALIYGSRKSVYGPVKFVVDLTPQVRAARQWIELLMACPHELQTVSEEVELYGLICEIHAAWQKTFLDDLMVSSPEALQGMIAHGTMIYVPLARLVGYFQKSVDPMVLGRLNFLISEVNNRQQLKIAEEETSGIVKVPDYQRIFNPLTTAQISKLAQDHGLDNKIVAEWSALRDVLNYYSWLGRRVGDSTVSDSSIIFLATKNDVSNGPDVDLKTECYPGVVALRATRLIDRWGSNWSRKLDTAFSVTAVDNMEELEKFKKGEPLGDEDLPAAETV